MQSTQLAHEDTARGQIQRVVDARATLFARPDLPGVTLRQFADTGQAVAEFDLAQPHNGLAAGSYCLVARYDPRVKAPAGEFDRLRWQMYLYDLKEPNRPAAAWVPFISRLDWRRDSLAHPARRRAPYPAVHFDFTVESDLPARKSNYTAAPTLRALYATNDFLVMSMWSMCVEGCCRGGVEALQPY